MPADLLTPIRLRLMAAGWLPFEAFGLPRWRSPDGKIALAEDEAVARVAEIEAGLGACEK